MRSHPNQSCALRPILLSFMFPGAADPDFVVNDQDLATPAVGDLWTILNARMPQGGRNLTLTLTDASGTTLSATVRFTGVDQFGNAIQEDISAVHGTPGVGSKIFVSVSRAEVLAVANFAASDLGNVGHGDKIGFPFKLNPTETATVTRTASAAAAVTFVDSSTYIDRQYSAIKSGVGSGGSGVLANTDCISLLLELESTGPDDRFVPPQA